VVSFKGKDIGNALSRKGFHANPDSHHVLYVYYLDNGKTAARTFVSHGNKEYSDILLSRMKNQLGLTKEQLHDLIKCPLTKDQLRDIYNKKE
jgi:hypothetical protein